MNFPIFKTKINKTITFDLSDPKERKKYFQLKTGPEIKKIKNYLKKHTFIVYLLGKKNSGKGTYSKLFKEAIGSDKVAHFSIGDMTRKIEKEWSSPKTRKEIMEFLKKNYRGYISLEDALLKFKERDTKSLLPTELILALIKREISKLGKKTLFIDGFPRNLNQISYSLFFRDLINYRKDPDIFVLIDVPEQAINERIKHRRICPVCQTPRNLKLFPTQEIKYDQKNKEFYLVCDNKNCNKARMLSKEGDELGIEPIKNRLEMDEKLMQEIISLHGIPKIFLRNSIPVKNAKQYIDDYEITPKYSYKWDKKTKNVQITEDPWTIKDSQGVISYSLLAPPATVSLIKQMSKILNL